MDLATYIQMAIGQALPSQHGSCSKDAAGTRVVSTEPLDSGGCGDVRLHPERPEIALPPSVLHALVPDQQPLGLVLVYA